MNSDPTYVHSWEERITSKSSTLILMKLYEINALDRYFMIDMTRSESDHQFIQKEQQRLNKKYPDRVFIINGEQRAKQIRDNTVLETVGFWSPFYKFLDTFKDNDVIIKMDDDTVFIDVETLRSAAELRWKNKDPLIMHSNCINNGITAYHQAQQGIWRFEDPEINLYPSEGLTGPLFAHPDVACKCHKQFVNDLLKDPKNLESTGLKKNIYFAKRVSINCMFMLGADRRHFSDINSQDEYLTSSKLGQEQDRPNMIIGDFITAHHTYGVQEPCMEEHGTFEFYKELRDQWFSKEVERTNNSINHKSGCPTAIRLSGNYLTRSWMNSNSRTIKNCRTEEYMIPREEVKTRAAQNEGGDITFLHTKIGASKDHSYAFDIDENINVNSQLLKTGHPQPQNPRFITFLVGRFFQQNYKKNGIILHKNTDGSYRIESKKAKGFFLFSQTNPKGETSFLFKKEDDNFKGDDWELRSYSDHENHLLMSRIVRENIYDYENDPTYAEAVDDPSFPQYRGARGFYWTTRGHLWEFIKLENGYYNIKCIDDEREDVWLTNLGGTPKTSTSAHQWKVTKRAACCLNEPKYELREANSNLALHLTEEGKLTLQSSPTLFDLNLNED